MILRQHQSLGMLPELIALVFLVVAVVTLAFVLWRVAATAPIALVPNSVGAGALAPARADADYCRAFSANFLAQWTTWNQYTFRARTRRAIEQMTPSARAAFIDLSDRKLRLVESLGQTQSLIIDRLDVTDLDRARGLHGVRFAGALRSFYGGVGGAPEPYAGQLLLREIAPTPDRPLCLEVVGFVIDRAPDPAARNP